MSVRSRGRARLLSARVGLSAMARTRRTFAVATLVTAVGGTARRVNNSDVATGEVYLSTGPHAVVWTNNAIEDANGTAQWSSAYDINNTGVIVGDYLATAAGHTQGFVRSPGGSIVGLPQLS